MFTPTFLLSLLSSSFLSLSPLSLLPLSRSLFSTDPNDIVDGNLKLLLGILWRFIFKYQISGNLHKPRLSRPNSVSDETPHTHREMSASKMLLAWFQASLPQFTISNFSQDWSDGVKLSALVNYCKPGLIPNWDQKDPQNAFENIHNAISLAHEHFTIPEVLHAEDLAVEKPDRQAVMTYLSYFCCPGSPGEKVLMEWIELVIPEVKITNFTSDWKDGESLCALVSAFAPSAISREALEGKSNVEITRAAMEAAKEQFNISCLSSPEEFTSPTCDQLSVMVYLSHFRFIKEERRKLPYLSALGSGITGTEIGTEAQLQIEGETLDGSIVEVRVQSPDLGEVEVHEIPVRSGTPGFQYRPTVPGTYTVEVKYSGEHVKGSPYKVRHLPPLDSVTGGRGLHRACVGRQAEFTVDVSNLGEGVLNFRILDPDDMPLDNVHMTEATAEYTVTYTPWRSGDHKIQLEWDCTPVTDEIDVDESFNTLECTYTVSVFDISKCVVRGSGLSEAIIGELASFEIETSAVGKGSLSTILTGPGNPDMKLVSIDDDVYAYEYTPEMEGELQFDIMWEMVPIPGSPFKLTPSPRTPAMECVIKEAPTGPVRACTAFNVTVVTPPNADCQLEGKLVSARCNKPCTVTNIDGNTHAVTVCPIDVGSYEVHITYGGNKIPGSPVKIDVNDPSKCWVVNPEVLATGSWQCGQQVLVRVSTAQAGNGKLIGKVRGPTQAVASETVEEEEGNQLVCFTPTETGQYSIDLFFDEERFQERASKIRVEDDSLEGIAITKPVSQTGYHHANKQLDIWISAPGRDEKLFTIDAKGVQTGATPTFTLVPTGEDTYSIHFTASQPDDYRIGINYNGKSIPGSPFILAIGIPPCPEKVEAYDPVLPFKASGDPIELLFNVRDAGIGSLTAKVNDSTSDDCFQWVSIEEAAKDLHRVSFVPPKNDVYTVRVEWSGQSVPGSPFRIDYREQEVEPHVCIEFEPDEGTPSKVTAAAEGAASGLIAAQVRQFKRGRYQISFDPPVREVFKLMVFWFKREIKGSPFVVDLTPSPPKSLPEGVRVVSLPVSVNQESGVFSAFATDSHSNLVRPQLSLSPKADSIKISFPDLKKESYSLFAFWNKSLISGSPFKIDLRA